ncbi:MAG: 50S ribosomal protein L20 [Candidatus Omnitrophica bacterium]|nr:50S ribosomal protein L20 [Candidatus Omnitrophota bacterium]
MAKVKWAVASRARRKRLLRKAKGYRGARRLHLLKAKETVMRAQAYATRDRKNRKRVFRSLWIIRLNAAAREHGLTYGRFMAACRRAKVQLDRKQLAELAVNDRATFDQLVAQVTAAR